MSGNLVSLITPYTDIRVSSTLDKSVGKKYLIDNNPETCWTSQQGLPQHIQLTFAEPVIPTRVSLTFQGGFVGTLCAVYFRPEAEADWLLLTNLYPDDVNRRQKFDLVPPDPNTIQKGTHSLKLVFEQSSDFFGRVTMYDLIVEGTTVTN